MKWQEHPDADVKQALIKLCDALCSWERNTGRQSLLILKEFGGFSFRADCGKPVTSNNDDISDEQMLQGFRTMEGSLGYRVSK